jgi:D-sedoheptulose 7-phosphate isomerase
MHELIQNSVREAIRAANALASDTALTFMKSLATTIVETYREGGKILIAGNGGSLCDAIHFAEEMTGFFRKKRAPLPAIALADPGHMSCVANDLSYEEVFARGVEAHGKKGDVLVLLSTSGNSENLIRAAKTGNHLGLKTVAFLGKSGGRLKGVCDLELIISGFEYSDRIQEAHMAAIHIVIEAVECELVQETEKVDHEPVGTY